MLPAWGVLNLFRHQAVNLPVQLSVVQAGDLHSWAWPAAQVAKLLLLLFYTSR